MLFSFGCLLFYQIFSLFTFQILSRKFPIPSPCSAPQPTHSHVLARAFPCTGAYKVCKTKGHLFPMMANQAIFCYICSQRHELQGYWLVHNVDPFSSLGTFSSSSMGALCSIQQMTVSIHFCVCQALAKPHKRQLYQDSFSKILLAYAIVSVFGG